MARGIIIALLSCFVLILFSCKIVRVYRFTNDIRIKRILFASHKEIKTKGYLSCQVKVYRLPKGFIYKNDTNQLKPYIDAIVKKNKLIVRGPYKIGYTLQNLTDSMVVINSHFHNWRDAMEKDYYAKNEIVFGVYSYGKF